MKVYKCDRCAVYFDVATTMGGSDTPLKRLLRSLGSWADLCPNCASKAEVAFTHWWSKV